MHGFYRARVEQLFAQLWQWKIVCNIWDGVEEELHQYVHILLHIKQFVLNRKLSINPMGPGPMCLPHCSLMALLRQLKKLMQRECRVCANCVPTQVTTHVHRVRRVSARPVIRVTLVSHPFAFSIPRLQGNDCFLVYGPLDKIEISTSEPAQTQVLNPNYGGAPCVVPALREK